MWWIYAVLSAVFAALTSILAKMGIAGVNSHLATAIRTVVVLVMAWGMVFLTQAQSGIGEISRKSWLFLILSGLATGISWLFYYRALQLGDASKVVPIDTVGIDIEGNFDLGNTAGSGSNTAQLEAAQGLVVGSHLTLALQHMAPAEAEPYRQ